MSIFLNIAIIMNLQIFSLKITLGVLLTLRKSNGDSISLPKLFRPTVRINCSSDQEKCLKFEAEGREFSNCLRSLE